MEGHTRPRWWKVGVPMFASERHLKIRAMPYPAGVACGAPLARCGLLRIRYASNAGRGQRTEMR